MTQATETLVHLYKTEMRPSAKQGELVKTQVHTGTEYRREAPCPKCHKKTANFEGVNASGWLFRCAGGGKLLENDPKHTHAPYLFVAEPATQTIGAS